MKENLTGTDIRWIAKGYWDKYFDWRLYHGVKVPWAMAGVFAVLIAAVAFTVSALVEGPAPEWVSLVIMGLGVPAVFGMFWGMYRYGGAKDEFIAEAVARWENGDHRIPDTDTVVEYLSKGGRIHI